MNKQEFIDALASRLKGLPYCEVSERLNFYIEMIDDRVEDGLSEEEAVFEIGSVEEVVSQIVADTPLLSIAKEKIKPKRRMRPWEIVLLAVGSPIWVSLIISALAVVFALYVSAWSVIASIWACFFGVAVGSVAGILGLGYVFSGNVGTPFALFGAGLFLAGLAVFMFFGCLFVTKGALKLTKGLIVRIKKCLVGKEKA